MHIYAFKKMLNAFETKDEEKRGVFSVLLALEQRSFVQKYI
jgi:hypothetical protein